MVDKLSRSILVHYFTDMLKIPEKGIFGVQANARYAGITKNVWKIQFLWSYDRIVCTKHKREEYKHVIPSTGSISNLCYCLARIKRYFDIACDLLRSGESKHYLEYQTLFPHHKRYFITRNIDSIGFRGRGRVIFSIFRKFWKLFRCKFKK